MNAARSSNLWPWPHPWEQAGPAIKSELEARYLVVQRLTQLFSFSSASCACNCSTSAPSPTVGNWAVKLFKCVWHSSGCTTEYVHTASRVRFRLGLSATQRLDKLLQVAPNLLLYGRQIILLEIPLVLGVDVT